MTPQSDRAAGGGPSEQSGDTIGAALLCSISEVHAPATDLDVLHQLVQPLAVRADCRQVAQELLEAFGSVGGVLGARREHLASFVGQPIASYLSSVRRAFEHVLRERLKDRPVIGSWTALEEYLSVALRHERIEKLLVLFLDGRNGLICDEVLQKGSVDHVPTYPREIAKRALQLDASAVIMVHNHPSGDPTPSRLDVEMTKQVTAALASLGIAMHDHAIVGRNEVVSLRRTAML